MHIKECLEGDHAAINVSEPLAMFKTVVILDLFIKAWSSVLALTNLS